ncbi:hypothetical protein FISHEDRAFT_16820, partial [Fistulina hepatica ATCC 64428]
MQRPTLVNVRIRSPREALQVFYGVARNRLPLLVRRLDVEERRAIASGNVYVWEERGVDTAGVGMERWTDGFSWGPSRVRDDFLFYQQKESDDNDVGVVPTSGSWNSVLRSYPTRSNALFERLVKQTYSVHVTLPSDRPGTARKWHLTAYFSPTTLDNLHTIDTIAGIGDVAVPQGWFRSTRANKNGRDMSFPAPDPYTTQPSGYRIANEYPPRGSHPGDASRRAYPDGYGEGPHPAAARSNMGSDHSRNRLVPLSVLKTAPPQRRSPDDEEILARFAA